MADQTARITRSSSPFRRASVPVRRWAAVGSWLVALVLLGGVIAVVLHMGELGRFLELARRADPAWLIVALALQAGTYLAVAWVWWSALAAAGYPGHFARLLRLAIVKLFADQCFPTSGLSGTVIMTRALSAQGVPWSVALGAMLFGTVTHYTAYLAAVLGAIGALWALDAVKPVYLALALLASCVAVGVPILLLLAKRWAGRKRIKVIARWLGVGDALGSLASAPTDLLRRPVLLLGAAAAQAGVFLLDALTLVVIFRALGEPVGLEVAFPALVMAIVAVTLGPLPISVGTFEAACVAMLVSLHISAESALAATLLLRGFTFWLPMLPGSLMLRRELKPVRPAPPAVALPLSPSEAPVDRAHAR